VPRSAEGSSAGHPPSDCYRCGVADRYASLIIVGAAQQNRSLFAYLTVGEVARHATVRQKTCLGSARKPTPCNKRLPPALTPFAPEKPARAVVSRRAKA